MPAVFRAAPANTQKVLSGQAFFQPDGFDAAGVRFPLRTLGNVEVVRTVKTETLDITTNEVPEKPILKRVTTTLNEELKITCMSFIPLVQALAHMAPPGEVYLQKAVAAGEVDVPATAKDYDILECRDEDGNRVYGVTFTGTLDRTKYNYDARSGRVEVIGDLVVQAGSSYVARGDHTAGAFGDDLLAGRWQVVAKAGQDPFAVKGPFNALAVYALGDSVFYAAAGYAVQRVVYVPAGGLPAGTLPGARDAATGFPYWLPVTEPSRAFDIAVDFNGRLTAGQPVLNRLTGFPTSSRRTWRGRPSTCRSPRRPPT